MMTPQAMLIKRENRKRPLLALVSYVAGFFPRTAIESKRVRKVVKT